MLIYLCSRYSRRDEMRLIRDQIHAMGHTVVSRWLDTNWEMDKEKYASNAPEEHRPQAAIEDVEDVRIADCLIAFTESERKANRGGRHVEYGIALALEKRIMVVGVRENLFYYHPAAEIYPNVEDMLDAIRKVKPAVEKPSPPPSPPPLPLGF